MFLMLVSAKGNNLVVAVDQIVCMLQDHEGEGFTYIRLKDGSAVNVKESVTAILELKAKGWTHDDR